MDDRLDGFYPQGSTQWDALGHLCVREHGFWSGITRIPMDGPTSCLAARKPGREKFRRACEGFRNTDGLIRPRSVRTI
jgi:hypothetical protein